MAPIFSTSLNTTVIEFKTPFHKATTQATQPTKRYQATHPSPEGKQAKTKKCDIYHCFTTNLGPHTTCPT